MVNVFHGQAYLLHCPTQSLLGLTAKKVVSFNRWSASRCLRIRQ